MQNEFQNNKPRIPRWIFFAIFIFIIVIVAIILLWPKDPTIKEEQEIDAATYDITDLDETLSDTLSASVENSPHKDYQTELEETKHFGLTPNELCAKLSVSCLEFKNFKNFKNLSKISPINSNALNYYLDNNYIVIISSSTSLQIIYGALYSISSYSVFDLSSSDLDGYNYASRIDIFNHLTGSEEFYTIKL